MGLILKNNNERKELLSTWKSWPVLVTVPELNLIVREYVLPDESRILSFDYGKSYMVPYSEEIKYMDRKILLRKGQSCSDDNTADTYLIEHLKYVVPRK